MMQRGLMVALVVLLLVSGVPPVASAERIGTDDGAVVRVPAGQEIQCSDPVNAGRRPEFGATLAAEELNVGPASGRWGPPKMCLIHYPKEDVYNVVLTSIDSVDQYRQVKAEAINRLNARGIDMCRIHKWSWWGSQTQTGYTDDDYLALPVTCPPVVIAGDPDAEQHLPTASAIVGQAIDAISTDYGWRADQLITTIVVTNPDAAAELFTRYRPFGENPDTAARAGRAGISRLYTTLGSDVPYGNISIVNLVDPNQRTAANIGLEVHNAIGYFGILRIVGRDIYATTDSGNVPLWLRDGLVTRHHYRYALDGAGGGYLVEAAQAVRNGRAPRLADLEVAAGVNQAIQQFDWFTVTARRYGAVSYLYDTYGADAVRQYLESAHNRTMAESKASLAAMIGKDMDGLDAAVNEWLLQRPRILAANPEGRVKIEMLLFGDGQSGEALVEEAAAQCTFNVRTGAAEQGRPGIVGFSVKLAPDGSFTAVRPSTYVGNSVTLTGRLVNGQVSGTYRVVNEVTLCDGGAIPFGPA
jgi:hypothetical protein